MYELLKKIYFLIPFKKYLYALIKRVYKPSAEMSGYLKFNGVFNLDLGERRWMKIRNDNSTIPTKLFWNGLIAHEKETISIWQKLSKSSNCVFDLGANFGLFGLVSKTVNKNSSVHFFEPLSRNIDRINMNLTINNFDCEVNKVAVGDYVGEVTFYDMMSSENTIGSLSEKHVLKHSHHKKLLPIQVDMITIDNYVTQKKMANVDLIKIDVEGVEDKVLMGAKETIVKSKPHIILEVSDEDKAQKVNTFLHSIGVGYRIYQIDEKLGLSEKGDINKGTSRNFLLSMLSRDEIEHLYY